MRVAICKCRVEIKCEWCQKLIKVGDEHEAHYNGYLKEYAYCRECVRKQFDKLEGKEYNLGKRFEETHLSKGGSRY